MYLGFEFLISTWDYEGKKYVDNSCGETLYLNGLAERNFKIGNMEYILNSEGEIFINNISLESTSKEKEIYSNLIDYNVMSTLDNVMNHKKYYDSVMNKIIINDDIVKVARLHDKNFKDFFEEYSVLMKYAIAKYGENCKIRHCGRETNNQIKYDGIIEFNGIEERIEITTPFHTETEKEQMKKLNKFGTTDFKVEYYSEPSKRIRNTVQEAINKKNAMNSYDSSVSLVVLFDDFEYIISEQISDENYINDIFKDLKIENYKFKTVSVLVDRYNGNDVKLEPRIIEIKK